MRTKKLFLESADVGSQPIRPPSSCEALSPAFFFFFFSVKVAGLDLVIAKISAISVFFGSNFAQDFPVSVEFPAESSF